MPYLIGTDEAGYGPNLGPLTISVSAWWVPEALFQSNLYDVLSETVCEKPERKRAKAERPAKIAIADSKALYKPKGNVAALERGLLAALALLDKRPTDWDSLWSALTGDEGGPPQDLPPLPNSPWYDGYQMDVPWALTTTEREAATEFLAQGMSAAGVRLVALRSMAVFPERFNQLCAEFDSKGAALSCCTMELLSGVLATLDERAYVVCDKHGGRNRYATLLQEHFPDAWIQIRDEGRAESSYAWGQDDGRVEIYFRSKGERFLPAALASMACKYLRELAMRAFNEYWAARVEDLQPTAGYPVDAKRFKADIAAIQEELGISDDILWRSR